MITTSSPLLNSLNEIQWSAVRQIDEPLMILAGAGSGKTRTLVAKMVYLINEKGFSPHHILALTFSNKAAKEMRERLAHETGIAEQVLPVTTFHSFCARLLRTEFAYLGLGRNFTIYDTADVKSLLHRVLAARGLVVKEFPVNQLLAYIDLLKNEGYYLNKEDPSIDRQHHFFEYFLDYEHELHQANALDFGGLITAVLKLFTLFPDVLARYTQKYRYVLIDEYQDTNRAQFELALQLTSSSRKICVVGDEDQSIYSWRGARIENIFDLQKEFPNLQVIKLEQNYRSTQNIIRAAASVIARNKLRSDKQIWTANDEGESITIWECRDDRTECQLIREQIAQLKREHSISLNDVAIFYRNNAQSRLVEDALREANLPYRIIGGIRFYDRKEIKDILSYFRLILNAKDSLAFSRAIGTPARGIGATTIKKLETLALAHHISLWEVLDRLLSQGEFGGTFAKKTLAALTEFYQMVLELQRLNADVATTPSALYEVLLKRSGLYESYRKQSDAESRARRENLEELLTAITQFEQSTTAPTLANFMETITLDTSNESEASAPIEQISLMTIHGAKGLEFNFVFVIGVEENIFPSFRSLESEDEFAANESGLEEERRLFYVAVTRAMQRLWLSFCQSRMLFGQYRCNGPSRFLMEIPKECYHWHVSGSSNIYSPARPANNQLYPKFSQIEHGIYGQGIVLEVEGTGSDERVLIQFTTGERKKFFVKYAPLTLMHKESDH